MDVCGARLLKLHELPSPAENGKLKHYVHERVSPAVRDIALKAQSRLCAQTER
jgi:hypothetical protein